MKAACGAGQAPDSITIAPFVPCAVAEDAGAARHAVRRHVAYYVGSAEGYRRAVGAAFDEGADAVAGPWRDGDREGAAERVTDAMVDAPGVAGTPETAPAAFRELVESGPIDHPIVVVPEAADEAMTRRTVETLAPG